MRGEIARVRRRPRSRRQSLLLPGPRRGHALKRKDVATQGALSGVWKGQQKAREGQRIGRQGNRRVLGAPCGRHAEFARNPDVAADALADILKPRLLDFFREKGVGDGRTGDADEVREPLLDDRRHAVRRGVASDPDDRFPGDCRRVRSRRARRTRCLSVTAYMEPFHVRLNGATRCSG